MEITDKQRLDFIERGCFDVWYGEQNNLQKVYIGTIEFFSQNFDSSYSGKTLREAIDAAIMAMSQSTGEN